MKWEYKKTGKMDEKDMDKLGKDGWELVEEPVSEDLEKEEFVDTEEIINEIDPEHKVCVITDLEKAAMEYFKQTLYNGNDSKMQAFKAGAKWQKEQFEKNRLKHCNSITNEQAELEQGFIDQHLNKYQRMPTFLDAIEYGMRLQQEQMMAKAADMVVGYWMPNGLMLTVDETENCYNIDEGDRVKVIVIKED